jgi:hypothetical protein
VNRDEIRKRALYHYEDELQYAIARDDEVDVVRARARAAARIGREMDGQDISGVWLGYIEAIARGVERRFEIDLTSGQLRMSGAVRVGDLVLVPAARMRLRDWLAFDARREAKFEEHANKRNAERKATSEIIDRLRAFGGDPTTFEACPDLFPEAQAA